MNPTFPAAMAQWRRALERIELRIATNAAERTRIEEELGNCPEHGKLGHQQARLTQDAASSEARWMEVVTAIEQAEAQRRPDE
jgi:predicted anti-sigma-YlaC factor YlaD